MFYKAAKEAVSMGRKKIELDWEEFNKLCEMQCTLMEIAHWFRCSEDTIERRVKEEHKMLFADYFKKESAGGRISLRRKQNEVAQAGSVPMLIWLGKQHLGQVEKVENTDTTDYSELMRLAADKMD